MINESTKDRVAISTSTATPVQGAKHIDGSHNQEDIKGPLKKTDSEPTQRMNTTFDYITNAQVKTQSF